MHFIAWVSLAKKGHEKVVRILSHMKPPTSKDAPGESRPVTGTTADVPALVTKPVVAKAASTSPRTIDNWMRQKRIPFIKLSPRCVRFHLPSVLAALRQFEVQAIH